MLLNYIFPLCSTLTSLTELKFRTNIFQYFAQNFPFYTVTAKSYVVPLLILYTKIWQTIWLGPASPDIFPDIIMPSSGPMSGTLVNHW